MRKTPSHPPLWACHNRMLPLSYHPKGSYGLFLSCGPKKDFPPFFKSMFMALKIGDISPEWLLFPHQKICQHHLTTSSRIPRQANYKSTFAHSDSTCLVSSELKHKMLLLRGACVKHFLARTLNVDINSEQTCMSVLGKGSPFGG